MRCPGIQHDITENQLVYMLPGQFGAIQQGIDEL